MSALLRKYGVAGRRELAALAEVAEAAVPGRVAGLPAARTSFVGRARGARPGARRAGRAPHRHADRPGRSREDPPGDRGGRGRRAARSRSAASSSTSFRSGAGSVAAGRGRRARRGGAPPAAAGGRDHRPPRPGPLAARARQLRARDRRRRRASSSRVLAACPQVTILATSRERLGVAGEHTVAVGPLADAEQLFHDRTSAAGFLPPSTRRWSPSCAPGWTACRWRSNSPPRAAPRSAPTACAPRSTITCGC